MLSSVMGTQCVGHLQRSAAQRRQQADGRWLDTLGIELGVLVVVHAAVHAALVNGLMPCTYGCSLAVLCLRVLVHWMCR